MFTSRDTELAWLYGGGAGMVYPQEWAEFVEPVPEAQRDDLLGAYQRLVDDPATSLRAAIAWSEWEAAVCALVPSPALAARYADPEYAVPFARIALHYFRNGSWLDDGQLIRDAGTLAGIPGVIVQGRYDLVCPPVSAWELHRGWPDSELVLLPLAGHAVADHGVLDALTAATDRFRPGAAPAPARPVPPPTTARTR